MTMIQNWSTKDEIETSIRTFQSVRDEWRGDENGREILYFIQENNDLGNIIPTRK